MLEVAFVLLAVRYLAAILQAAMLICMFAALCVIPVWARWSIPSSSCNFSHAMRDPDITGYNDYPHYPHVYAARIAANVFAARAPVPGDVSSRLPAASLLCWTLVSKRFPLIRSTLMTSVHLACRWELELVPPMSMLTPPAEPSRDMALTKVYSPLQAACS